MLMSPLKQRALHILITFTIDGSDGNGALTCISKVVMFLPDSLILKQKSNILPYSLIVPRV